MDLVEILLQHLEQVLLVEVEEEVEDIILHQDMLLVLVIQVLVVPVVVLVLMILHLVLVVVVLVVTEIQVVIATMELDGVVPEEVVEVDQEVHTQMVALVDLEDLELVFHHL
tara:strand:- start:26 stop:361 length:336 start_codon:yes stop_codon:yes gene_type:complete